MNVSKTKPKDYLKPKEYRAPKPNQNAYTDISMDGLSRRRTAASVVETGSEMNALLVPSNAGELHSYIDLPERHECPAFG